MIFRPSFISNIVQQLSIAVLLASPIISHAADVCTSYELKERIRLANGTESISSTLNVTDKGTISDLDVKIQMNHKNVGDLTIVLTNVVTDTSVTLVSRPGITSGDRGCKGNNIDVHLDDDAVSSSVDNQCADTTPTISGTFNTTEQKLGEFNGLNTNSTWKLKVTDGFPTKQAGTLKSWSLNVCTDDDTASTITSADLDGDGDLDVLQGGNDGILWYENLGDGGDFNKINTIDAIPATSLIATADIDGDGDLDILSVSTEGKVVSWYENTGGGAYTTTPSQIIDTHYSILSIITADIDGDGDLDMLLAGATNTGWYENTERGFTYIEIDEVQIAESSENTSLATADIDRDGDLDVLLARGNSIVWYPNNGGGTFNNKIIIKQAVGDAEVHSAIVVDVDKNGDLDVLSVVGSDIILYKNSGNGDYYTPIEIDKVVNELRSAIVVDVDKDGDLDVVSAQNETIMWYRNDDGNFITARLFSGELNSAVDSVFMGDVDNDGDIDVLASNTAEGTFQWVKNDIAPQFDRAAFDGQKITINNVYTGGSSITTADIDGDGILDMVTATQGGNVSWHKNNGNGETLQSNIIATDIKAIMVYTVDLDRDGDQDVLSTSYTGNEIAWYKNQGEGSFTTHSISDKAIGAISVTTADVDLDGDIDVLSASRKNNTIALYRNDGNQTFDVTEVITSQTQGAWSVRMADMDGDGDPDAVTASQEDNTIAWYANDSKGGFSGTPTVIANDVYGARRAHPVDLDRDGDIDVITVARKGDNIVWYANEGDGKEFQVHIIDSDIDFPISVDTADLDLDGDLDVLAASFIDDSIIWYQNDGKQQFTRNIISDDVNGARWVSTADLDRDGDLDVLAAALYNENSAPSNPGVTFQWFENKPVTD